MIILLMKYMADGKSWNDWAIFDTLDDARQGKFLCLENFLSRIPDDASSDVSAELLAFFHDTQERQLAVIDECKPSAN